MKKLIFNKNYENNVFNIEFLNKKNFTIFKIKNFLDKDSYKFIKESIPMVESNRLNNFDLDYLNNKYNISSTDEHYKNLLKDNKRLQIIHDEIFSKKFFDYFYNNLKIEFLKSRVTDLKYLIKLLKPKIEDLSKNYLKNFFYTHISRQIEYSYIFNKGKIVPHTDGRYKLLSLLIFFPEGREEENEIGTTFWDSKQKNLRNKHLRDPQKEKYFKEHSKVLTKIDFNKYDLYGFIRTARSWHSVEPFDLGENYVRKSLNINFTL